jgi:hypothetical protein
MKNKINFLTIIAFMLLTNTVKAQTSGTDKKPVLEKIYWFTVGIEKQGADLLLNNPTVFSEIIPIDCDRSAVYTIADKFEAFFEAKHASSQGVTGVYLSPFAFLTPVEAETKRNELKANVESKNGKIYPVNNFKANFE